MKTIKNLVGEKFNYVTVLSLNDNRDNQGKILWNCVCDCGKMMVIRTFSLKNIKSCGCKNNTKKENMALNCKYATYKRDILKKNLEWNLTKDEFYNLIQGNCHYCNSEPILWSPYFNKFGKMRHTYFNKMNNYDYMEDTKVKINGIDRLDSSIGYNIDNCVPCCTKCNIIKNAYSKNDFFLQIKKIYEFNKLSETELINEIECETTKFINNSKL